MYMIGWLKTQLFLAVWRVCALCITCDLSRLYGLYLVNTGTLVQRRRQINYFITFNILRSPGHWSRWMIPGLSYTMHPLHHESPHRSELWTLHCIWTIHIYGISTSVLRGTRCPLTEHTRYNKLHLNIVTTFFFFFFPQLGQCSLSFVTFCFCFVPLWHSFFICERK